MKKIDDWICTDPDNFQYGRKISDDMYEFKEWNKSYCSSGICNSKEFKESQFNYSQYWIELTINLSYYSEKQIRYYISAYYDSINEIKKIYGNNAEWIIAECIFEQESELY